MFLPATLELVKMHGAEKLFRDYVHLTPAGNDVITNELEPFVTAKLTALAGRRARSGGLR